MRKKIWGTSNPPGEENPYGAPGILEQRRQDKKAIDDENGAVQTELSPTPIEDDATEDFDEDEEEYDATTWAGMPVVGGPDWGLDEWDESHPYRGYMVNPRPESREEIISITHRALVEVMTLKAIGMPLEMDRDSYDATDDYKRQIAKAVTFHTDASGQIHLKLESEELERSILDLIEPRVSSTEEETAQGEEPSDGDFVEAEEQEMTLESADVQEMSASSIGMGKSEGTSSEQTDGSGPSIEDDNSGGTTTNSSEFVPADDGWLSVSLADPEFKFAVLKRVMQLTGRRIPDPDIQSIKDFRALLVYLVKKPKPRKLAETLFANDAIDLPNVEVRERRFTPIDKEKEIGRWKVIERELEARGLPVTGRGLVSVGEPLA